MLLFVLVMIRVAVLMCTIACLQLRTYTQTDDQSARGDRNRDTYCPDHIQVLPRLDYSEPALERPRNVEHTERKTKQTSTSTTVRSTRTELFENVCVPSGSSKIDSLTFALSLNPNLQPQALEPVWLWQVKFVIKFVPLAT